MFLLIEKSPEMVPYKGRGVVSTPVCANKMRKCWPRLFYSQPRQLPCAQHIITMPTHILLSHLFCLYKTYLPNGSCQLAKRHHWWL